ncbi:hypothetical protein P152DRAFT_470740 [Eremomyces bilateralis CBS 781.70]|uniref:Uncharacterized protein n=1 Tax=Eremomyces bilateralis CBS 781.70 TaxID=1392243 RepID=A0A6G1GB23_9PEZI|nr:uncharacterized protein P152DRAFT_470740 [Eremomyces bilateralis CBS 781.70]KAF1815288.1 hypothetical protein P152DRAFT_470740 [Eremomyces bilateralis CBS 781.70]
MDSPPRRGARARPALPTNTSSYTSHPTYTTAPSTNPSATTHPNPPSLALPNLPRFHPANFPSTTTNSTPSNPPPIPQPPPSPRTTSQRPHSDAQRALYAYQRELLASQSPRPPTTRQPSGGAPSSPFHAYGGAPFPMMTGMAFAAGPSGRPVSPKLVPLAGSPGPVTPLELEGEMKGGDYLSAGTRREGEGG